MSTKRTADEIRKDYNEIKEKFSKFVKAWETTEVDAVDDCMLVDGFANFSIFGECHSRDLLKWNLKQRTRETTYSRFNINSYVCLIEGNKAQQTAAIDGLLSDNTGEYAHYCFNGFFAVSWVKTAVGWRMADIKFDLIVDDAHILGRGEDGSFIINEGPGDLSFVKNWAPITDFIGWYEGVPLPVISGEYDAPWYVIKNRENIGTDEEQLEEMFYKYCFSIDYDSFKFFDNIFADDCVTYLPPLGIMDKRTITATLKINRTGSRRCLHIGKPKSIEVNGNKAKLVFYHKANAMIAPAFEINEKTEKQEIAASRWFIDAEKINGQWRFVKFYYSYGAFIEGTEDISNE